MGFKDDSKEVWLTVLQIIVSFWSMENMLASMTLLSLFAANAFGIGLINSGLEVGDGLGVLSRTAVEPFSNSHSSSSSASSGVQTLGLELSVGAGHADKIDGEILSGKHIEGREASASDNLANLAGTGLQMKRSHSHNVGIRWKKAQNKKKYDFTAKSTLPCRHRSSQAFKPFKRKHLGNLHKGALPRDQALRLGNFGLQSKFNRFSSLHKNRPLPHILNKSQEAVLGHENSESRHSSGDKASLTSSMTADRKTGTDRATRDSGGDNLVPIQNKSKEASFFISGQNSSSLEAANISPGTGPPVAIHIAAEETKLKSSLSTSLKAESNGDYGAPIEADSSLFVKDESKEVSLNDSLAGNKNTNPIEAVGLTTGAGQSGSNHSLTDKANLQTPSTAALNTGSIGGFGGALEAESTLFVKDESKEATLKDSLVGYKNIDQVEAVGLTTAAGQSGSIHSSTDKANLQTPLTAALNNESIGGFRATIGAESVVSVQDESKEATLIDSLAANKNTDQMGAVGLTTAAGQSGSIHSSTDKANLQTLLTAALNNGSIGGFRGTIGAESVVSVQDESKEATLKDSLAANKNTDQMGAVGLTTAAGQSGSIHSSTDKANLQTLLTAALNNGSIGGFRGTIGAESVVSVQDESKEATLKDSLAANKNTDQMGAVGLTTAAGQSGSIHSSTDKANLQTLLTAALNNGSIGGFRGTIGAESVVSVQDESKEATLKDSLAANKNTDQMGAVGLTTAAGQSGSIHSSTDKANLQTLLTAALNNESIGGFRGTIGAESVVSVKYESKVASLNESLAINKNIDQLEAVGLTIGAGQSGSNHSLMDKANLQTPSTAALNTGFPEDFGGTIGAESSGFLIDESKEASLKDYLNRYTNAGKMEAVGLTTAAGQSGSIHSLTDKANLQTPLTGALNTGSDGHFGGEIGAESSMSVKDESREASLIDSVTGYKNTDRLDGTGLSTAAVQSGSYLQTPLPAALHTRSIRDFGGAIGAESSVPAKDESKEAFLKDSLAANKNTDQMGAVGLTTAAGQSGSIHSSTDKANLQTPLTGALNTGSIGGFGGAIGTEMPGFLKDQSKEATLKDSLTGYKNIEQVEAVGLTTGAGQSGSIQSSTDKAYLQTPLPAALNTGSIGGFGGTIGAESVVSVKEQSKEAGLKDSLEAVGLATPAGQYGSIHSSTDKAHLQTPLSAALNNGSIGDFGGAVGAESVVSVKDESKEASLKDSLAANKQTDQMEAIVLSTAVVQSGSTDKANLQTPLTDALNTGSDGHFGGAIGAESSGFLKDESKEAPLKNFLTGNKNTDRMDGAGLLTGAADAGSIYRPTDKANLQSSMTAALNTESMGDFGGAIVAESSLYVNDDSKEGIHLTDGLDLASLGDPTTRTRNYRNVNNYPKQESLKGYLTLPQSTDSPPGVGVSFGEEISGDFPNETKEANLERSLIATSVEQSVSPATAERSEIVYDTEQVDESSFSSDSVGGLQWSPGVAKSGSGYEEGRKGSLSLDQSKIYVTDPVISREDGYFENIKNESNKVGSNGSLEAAENIGSMGGLDAGLSGSFQSEVLGTMQDGIWPYHNVSSGETLEFAASQTDQHFGFLNLQKTRMYPRTLYRADTQRSSDLTKDTLVKDYPAKDTVMSLQDKLQKLSKVKNSDQKWNLSQFRRYLDKNNKRNDDEKKAFVNDFRRRNTAVDYSNGKAASDLLSSYQLENVLSDVKENSDSTLSGNVYPKSSQKNLVDSFNLLINNEAYDEKTFTDVVGGGYPPPGSTDFIQRLTEAINAAKSPIGSFNVRPPKARGSVGQIGTSFPTIPQAMIPDEAESSESAAATDDIPALSYETEDESLLYEPNGDGIAIDGSDEDYVYETETDEDSAAYERKADPIPAPRMKPEGLSHNFDNRNTTTDQFSYWNVLKTPLVVPERTEPVTFQPVVPKVKDRTDSGDHSAAAEVKPASIAESNIGHKVMLAASTFLDALKRVQNPLANGPNGSTVLSSQETLPYTTTDHPSLHHTNNHSIHEQSPMIVIKNIIKAYVNETHIADPNSTENQDSKDRANETITTRSPNDKFKFDGGRVHDSGDMAEADVIERQDTKDRLGEALATKLRSQFRSNGVELYESEENGEPQAKDGKNRDIEAIIIVSRNKSTSDAGQLYDSDDNDEEQDFELQDSELQEGAAVPDSYDKFVTGELLRKVDGSHSRKRQSLKSSSRKLGPHKRTISLGLGIWLMCLSLLSGKASLVHKIKQG